jgi:hypothetical protein
LRGLIKQLNKHLNKLIDYVTNPLGPDNTGILSDAIRQGNVQRAQSIIEGRIKGLLQSIRTYLKDIEAGL